MKLTFIISLYFLKSYGYTNEYIPINDYSILNNLIENNYNNIELPKYWDWGNINGTNYLTKNLNQHIPQYCGSCWAHGSLSALSDRIKINRISIGPDINLAIQYLLNCGNAGTCNGGNHLLAYKYIYDSGSIPFDTCLSYEACSHDSSEKECQNRNFQCNPENTCRTCNTFSSKGGKCTAISRYPNVSISSFGRVSGIKDMKKEIFNEGPIACGINAEKILDYHGGIINKPHALKIVNHIISIVGWGYSENIDKEYWIIRNSWGEYWGERGFLRIVAGENQLGVENECAWAIPDTWTELNYPCNEDGGNC